MILQKHLSVILGSFLCNDFLLCFIVPKVCKDFAVGQFQALRDEGNGAGAHQYGYGYEGGGAEMFLQKDKGSGQQTECGHRLFRWSCPDDGEQYAAGNHAEGEGGQQSVAIEAELLFLSLPDEFHRIQFALKAVHEVITVLEVRGIAVEQLGQSVVFFRHLFMFCFKWSRPRDSCFFTASSLQSTMRAISFIAYPFM